MELLAFPDVGVDDLESLFPGAQDVDEGTKAQLKREAHYAFYVDRQNAEIESVKRDEAIEIPVDFDYGAVGGLSRELTDKIEASRPGTLGQAARIEGMTPAALAQILANIRQRRAS